MWSGDPDLYQKMIKLYQFEMCPYCAKVRVKLDELGLKYKTLDVPHDREDPIRKDVAEKSGVVTVPVLEIDGKFIGESSEIIKYLEQNHQ